MSDIKELVRQAATGDQKAFEGLYEQTKSGVWFTCIGLLRNEEDAKDIMQETYITAFEKLSALQKPESIQSWLNRIAANKCKDHLRSSCNEHQAEESEETIEDIPDDALLPEEYVMDKAKRAIIMDIIENKLSEAQSRTIILYYFDELTAAEIAELMGCHEKTVLYRLKTARLKIKQEVLRYEEENSDRLHAIVPIPILTLLLRAAAENTAVPQNIVSFENNFPNPQTAPSNSAAAAASTGGKTMLNTLKAKIIAGACAAVVVGGGVAAAVILSNGSSKKPPSQITSTPTVSTPMVSASTVSTPTVSAPTVSTPDEPSTPTSNANDIYGKAVEGDWEYQYMKHRNKIDQSAVMITEYTGSEENVTIPSEIGGKPVKSLEDTFQYNKDIVEVTVPEGVIYLEQFVFNGCKSLKKVNLPSSLKKIGNGSFGDCKSLEYIEVPEGVEEIAFYAFKGSSSLKTVILPDSVREVGSDAFKQCGSSYEVHYKGKVYTKDTINELYELCPTVFDPND